MIDTTRFATREHGIDFLRVFAFALLIVYHSSLAYVSWPWLINDPGDQEAAKVLEPILLGINRWRLPLLFFISGMSAAFSLDRRSWSDFARERIKRLFLPVAIGTFLVCPPQTYLERIVHGNPMSYFELYRYMYIPAPAGTMTWVHLWFVAYILVFSILGMPALVVIRSEMGVRAIKAAFALCTRSHVAIYLMAVPSVLVAAVLGPRWPISYNLVSDWANLCAGFVLFLWGFAIGSNRNWLNLITARRHEFLLVGLGVAALFFAARSSEFTKHISNNWQTIFWSIVNSIYAITWILALVGFSRVHFTRKSTWLSAANHAVYPFYILHQTVTVVAVFLLLPWLASCWVKLPLVVAATFLVSFVAYEIIRRSRWLRPLFGIAAGNLTPKGLS